MATEDGYHLDRGEQAVLDAALQASVEVVDPDAELVERLLEAGGPSAMVCAAEIQACVDRLIELRKHGRELLDWLKPVEGG